MIHKEIDFNIGITNSSVLMPSKLLSFCSTTSSTARSAALCGSRSGKRSGEPVQLLSGWEPAIPGRLQKPLHSC